MNIHIQKPRYIAYVAAIGFIGCAFIGNIMLSSFEIEINLMWYLFLILLLISVFIIYVVLKQKEFKMRMIILVTKNEMLEKNYIQANEFYMANAKLYHDMNHHFEALYYMLQQGNKEQAKDYIEKLHIATSFSEAHVQSGINVLDAILYGMQLKAQNKGILFKVEVQLLPSNLGIESSDISSLFANLLENAIDAATIEIIVQIKRINQVLFIMVKNDYSIEPIRIGNQFLTNKKNKELHGWGTQIVDHIVQKYEGSIEYKIEDGYFTVSAIINEKTLCKEKRKA